MRRVRTPLLLVLTSLFLGASPGVMAQAVPGKLFGPVPLATSGFSSTPGIVHNVPPPPPDQPVQPMQASPPAPPRAQPVTARPVVHERVVARNDKRPSYHPESLALINEAAQKYLAIAQGGGWPILPAHATLQPGSEGESVITLRQRLAAEGDLPSGDLRNPVFDAPLAAAVKKFQARHGQSQNALVQGPTLAALRVSARERFTQLNESARRLANRNFAFGPRYVVVNIPSASVEAIENGVVEKRFIAVVGKKERASPEVETRITNVNLNPTWTVPVSIIKKDIIPKMQKDPAYLTKAKIRIYGVSGNEVDPRAIDWSTERAVAFTLRQEAGTANALGQLRIDMPNRESVYMHDTPSKRLFASDDRFHSSGCVRVENVRDFAAWILEGQQDWDRKAIDAAISEGKRKDVRLAHPIPVIWTYLTGYVTPEGTVHFRPDIYGLDSGPVLTAAEETPAPRRAKTQPVVLDARAASAPPIQRIDPQ
jgi:L,D-transpeptidase YcbB